MTAWTVHQQLSTESVMVAGPSFNQDPCTTALMGITREGARVHTDALPSLEYPANLLSLRT